jgi:hypothetical protein
LLWLGCPERELGCWLLLHGGCCSENFTVGCEDVQFTLGVEVLHVPALKIESGFLAGFEKLNAISDRPSLGPAFHAVKNFTDFHLEPSMC